MDEERMYALEERKMVARHLRTMATLAYEGAVEASENAYWRAATILSGVAHNLEGTAELFFEDEDGRSNGQAEAV